MHLTFTLRRGSRTSGPTRTRLTHSGPTSSVRILTLNPPIALRRSPSTLVAQNKTPTHLRLLPTCRGPRHPPKNPRADGSERRCLLNHRLTYFLVNPRGVRLLPPRRGHPHVANRPKTSRPEARSSRRIVSLLRPVRLAEGSGRPVHRAPGVKHAVGRVVGLGNANK